MPLMVRTTVELPYDLYVDLYVLVRDGEILSFKHAFFEAVKEYLQNWDREKIDRLREKYALELEAIKKRASVVERRNR